MITMKTKNSDESSHNGMCMNSMEETLLLCLKLLKSIKKDSSYLVAATTTEQMSETGHINLTGTRLLQYRYAAKLVATNSAINRFRACRMAIEAVTGYGGYRNPASLQRYLSDHSLDLVDETKGN